MKTTLAAGILLAALAAGCATPTSDPLSRNCNVDSPPADAGDVIGMHTGFFKVFPRRSEMGTSYSGCQTLWIDLRNGKFRKVLTAHFEGGALRYTRNYDPEEHVCKYESNKLVSGSQFCIDRPGFFPVKSAPAGCLEKAMRSGTPPPGCGYD